MPVTETKLKEATHLPPTLQNESSDEPLSPGEAYSVAYEFSPSQGGCSPAERGLSLEKAREAERQSRASRESQGLGL